MVIAGIPIDKALHATGFKLTLYRKIAGRIQAIQRDQDLSRANMIANAVGEMLGGS